MPFISDSELFDRMKSKDNLVNKITGIEVELDVEVETEEVSFPEPNCKVIPITRKTKGDIEVPLEIKKTLAILGNEGETQKSLAAAFAISQPSVSYFERGLATSSGFPNPELTPVLDKIQDKRKDAETKAIDSLVMALGLIPERLPHTKSLKTIASVAKTMAEISDKMGGREEGNAKTVHLHLYKPENKQVDEYDIIDITG